MFLRYFLVDLNKLLIINIPKTMIYKSIIFNNIKEEVGYSLKRMGTKYQVIAMGMLCAMYFGKLLRIRKSSKVDLVLLLNALNNFMIIFLMNKSRRYIITIKKAPIIIIFRIMDNSVFIPLPMKYS